MKKCKSCKLNKDIDYYYKQSNCKDGHKNICKSCYKIKRKEYRNNNREKILKYKRNYRKKLKDNDIHLYFLKQRCRNRIYLIFKSKNIKKKNKSIELLGCSYFELKKHLEKNFKKGMSWKNKGLWHIDHIIPLDYANTEEELIKLCHYTNLQPLWAKDNLVKSNKF